MLTSAGARAAAGAEPDQRAVGEVQPGLQLSAATAGHAGVVARHDAARHRPRARTPRSTTTPTIGPRSLAGLRVAASYIYGMFRPIVAEDRHHNGRHGSSRPPDLRLSLQGRSQVLSQGRGPDGAGRAEGRAASGQPDPQGRHGGPHADARRARAGDTPPSRRPSRRRARHSSARCSRDMATRAGARDGRPNTNPEA